MPTIATYIAPESYAAPTGSTEIRSFKYQVSIKDFHGNTAKFDSDTSSASSAQLINLGITLQRGATPDTGTITVDNTDFAYAGTFRMGDTIKVWLGFDTDNFTDSNYIFGGYIQKIEPNLTQEIKLSVVSWEAILNTCNLPRVNQEFCGQTPESIISAIYNLAGLGGSCITESTGLTFKKETFKKHLIGNAIAAVFNKVESFKGNGRENEANCYAWDPDATTCPSCGGAVQDNGSCNSCGSSNNTCNNCQNSACNNQCACGGCGSTCGTTCGSNCSSCAGSCDGTCSGCTTGTCTGNGGCNSGSSGCGGTCEGSEDITGTKTAVHYDLWMDEAKNLYFQPVRDASTNMPIYTYGDNIIAAKGLFNEIDCYNSVDCKSCVGEGVKWEGLEVPLDPSLNLYTNNIVYVKTPMNDSKARIDKISYTLSGKMTIDVVKQGSEAGGGDIASCSSCGSGACNTCGSTSCGGGCGAATSC